MRRCLPSPKRWRSRSPRVGVKLLIVSEARPGGVPARASLVGWSIARAAFASEPLLPRGLLKLFSRAAFRDGLRTDAGFDDLNFRVFLSGILCRPLKRAPGFINNMIPGFRSLRSLHPGLNYAASFAGSAPVTPKNVCGKTLIKNGPLEALT